jgi:hypothetical protein
LPPVYSKCQLTLCTIPNVIYTDPEIAWVGQSEQDLLAIGENIKISLSFMLVNGFFNLYLFIKVGTVQSVPNAKRGVSPHLKIRPCDLDLENQYGSRFS